MAIKNNEPPFVIGQKVTATIRNEVFGVHIRGWLKGSYVVTDLPKVSGGVYKVAPQTGVQIHFTREGLFVNFKTSASYALAQAISLLVLEYPRTIDRHNLRKFERFRTNIPTTLYFEEDGQKLENSGVIRDISLGGILISHKKEVMKQNLLYITAELPGGGSFKAQMADVKNLRKNPKSDLSPYVTGFKWKNLTPESEDGIKKLIAQRSKEKREGLR